MSWPWYRFAIETTSRRLELIIRSFASRSPCSMRRDSSDLLAPWSSRGWRRIVLQEEIERVDGLVHPTLFPARG